MGIGEVPSIAVFIGWNNFCFACSVIEFVQSLDVCFSNLVVLAVCLFRLEPSKVSNWGIQKGKTLKRSRLSQRI